METHRYYLGLVVTILFLFTSCSSYNSFFSIDKRKYRSGYHLETDLFGETQATSTDTINPLNKPPTQTSSSIPSSPDTTNTKSSLSSSFYSSTTIDTSELKTESASNSSIYPAPDSTISSDSLHVPHFSLLEASIKMLPVTVLPKLPPVPTVSDIIKQEEEESKDESMNIWALVGFITSLTLFLSPVGLSMSLLALDQINQDPGKYKGKGLAWAGVIIGSLLTLVLIIGLIIAIGPSGVESCSLTSDSCSSTALSCLASFFTSYLLSACLGC